MGAVEALLRLLPLLQLLVAVPEGNQGSGVVRVQPVRLPVRRDLVNAAAGAKRPLPPSVSFYDTYGKPVRQLAPPPATDRPTPHLLVVVDAVGGQLEHLVGLAEAVPRAVVPPVHL